MVERLSPLDSMFLQIEGPTAPMHVGGLIMLDAPDGFDVQRMITLLAERMHKIPRYRQRLRFVPGHLAHPVWVDDPNFDLVSHIQRLHLPQPANNSELMSLAGRLFSKQLDRNRPLWEAYLIEGLEDGRVAILTKAHHCMVDGVSAVDVLSTLVDMSPEPERMEAEPWTPEAQPSDMQLIASGMLEYAQTPVKAVSRMRDWAGSLTTNTTATLQETAGKIVGVVASAKRLSSKPDTETSLRAASSDMRRFLAVSQPFSEFREVRKAFSVSINDVALAVVTGALRTWMSERGESFGDDAEIRIMAPVSLRDPSGPTGGNMISAMFIDVPVGEPDPIERLKKINSKTSAAKKTGEAVAAAAMLPFADFIAPNLLAMGARVAMQAGVLDTVVTNVPGPQWPLWVNGCEVKGIYPFVTTYQDRTLTHAVISFNGTMCWGVTGERRAASDLPEYAAHLDGSLAELVALARAASAQDQPAG